MKAKRIWAILLSLAVLIGVMPMAGLMIGAAQETTDGLIGIDKGDTDAIFSDAAGTVNVTAPSGKLPYAVSEDGKTVYVANNKTTIGSDKTPVTDYVNTKYTDWGCFDNNGSYLVNTYNKLTQDKALNVVYFGGSLTAGYGCGVTGDPNGVTADGVKEDTHSWRGLSGKWLQQNFPNATINLVNCAIGESGTYLGTYRVQNDVIAAQPDLLFIEYAINDCYNAAFGTDKAAAKRQLETIVREVKSALPTCDIVITLTTDINYMSTTYSGGFFDQAAGHYELAEAYGLPVMNIGLGLAKNIAAIENNEKWWNDFWTDKAIWGKYFCDTVHPYSTGHEQYFLCVKEFLENNLLYTDFDGMSATATYYPPVVSENLFDGNRVTLFGTEMQSAVDTANSTGVSYNSGVVPGGLGSSQSAKEGYYSVAADGSITINFTGTEIALWNKLASGGTTYTYSIDGGAQQTLAKSGNSPTVFAKDLPSKAHMLTVSADAAMYIVGIFSRDAAAQTVQGTAFTYADGRKPMTLTLPAGNYTLGYAATIGELPLPTLDGGVTFFGWSTDGELLADTATLPVGATLKATDSSTVKTVYVRTSGADTNDGTEAAPFASLSAAMAAIIAEQDDYYAGEIVILDSVTASSTDAFGATNWTIPVTVRGSAAANTLTLSGKLYLYGDTTFDNITVATSGHTIYARRNEVHFTSSSKITGSGEVTLGLYYPVGDPAGTVPHKLTLEGAAALNSVNLASYLAHGGTAGRYVAGIDFVHNASAAPNWLYVGGYGDGDGQANYRGAAYFTDDVNMTINTAMPNSQFVLERAVYVTTQFNGHALQLIYNNGSFVEKNLNASSFTPLNQANVEAAGGTWYLLKAAAGGGMLSATDTAGTYAVSEGWIAIAKQNGVEVARSADGVLTVPAAGDYDVAWEVQPIEGTLEIYVDAANGNDASDGLTSAKAVKTLAQAMTLIRTSRYTAGKINVVGDYTMTSANEFGTTQFTKSVTVSGSGTNILTLAAHPLLICDTVFDNITISAGNYSMYAQHHAVEITDSVMMAAAGTPFLYLGMDSPGNVAAPTAPHKLTMSGGYFQSIVLANRNASSSYTDNRTIPGANFVYNAVGTSPNFLYIGGVASATTANAIFTDDVNITVNKPMSSTAFVLDRPAAPGVATSFTNGAAVQIIYNNGTYNAGHMSHTQFKPLNEANVVAAGGSLYVLKCATGGSTLSAVDKGVYKVADAKNWAAVAKQNGEEIARSKDGVLTVPAAGTYDISWEVPKFEGTMTLYVDQANGSDDDDGQSAATAFATLRKAMATVGGSGASDGVINIVGAYTVTSNQEMAPAGTADTVTTLYEEPITIKGATGAGTDYLYCTTALWLYGPTTFENITIQKSADAPNGEYSIYAQHNAVNFGDNASVNGVAVLNGGVWWANRQSASAVPHNITHDSGHIHTVYLGNFLGHCSTAARLVPGVNYVQNGGSVYYLRLGNNAYGATENSAGNIYTDDVNITINGGTVGTSGTGFAFDASAAIKKTTFFNNALQILFNNGTSMAANTTLPTAADVQAHGGTLYVLYGAAGVYLTVTDEAGVYTVEDGKIAAAYNESGALVAASTDGVLTVPAGTYTVRYLDSAPYTVDGLTLRVNTDIENFDYSSISSVAEDANGALFLGWYYANGTAGIATLKAGDVLTAKYSDAAWNADADGDGKGDNFRIVGSSLRKASANKSQALRFTLQLDKSVIEQVAAVEYGTVLLPNTLLRVSDLVLGGVYGYQTVTHYTAATVQGKNVFRETDTHVQYTAALTGIAVKNYLTAYAARGYMTYTDANGAQHTLYTDDTAASSINEVAELLLELEPADETAKELTQAVKDYYEGTGETAGVYNYTAITAANANTLLATKPGDGSSYVLNDQFYTDGFNGVYTTFDGTQLSYYNLQNKKDAVTVRELVIDLDDIADANETVIMQLTDTHLNYVNKQDYENKDTALGALTWDSWLGRTDQNTNLTRVDENYDLVSEHVSIAYHRNAMEYAAALGDLTVVTGDVFDYFSYGNLELTQRVFVEPYSNALFAIGNHEPNRLAGHATELTEDKSVYDRYYDQIGGIYNNDLYYASKVVDGKVMVIQMDNGNTKFWDSQVEKLSADLATARANGYTVLVFMHIPFRTENAELIYATSNSSGLSSGVNPSVSSAAQGVYDLLINNADIIGGLFTGHHHEDIYSVLTDTNSQGQTVSLKQYTLTANYWGSGHVMKITVR